MFSDKWVVVLDMRRLLGTVPFAPSPCSSQLIPERQSMSRPANSSFRPLPFPVILALFTSPKTMLQASVTTVADGTYPLIITIYDTKGVYV